MRTPHDRDSRRVPKCAPCRTASSIAFIIVELFAFIHCATEPESTAETWTLVVG
jgi:prepilin signal peptidase PulO-like enzyme (type II secretory pathway)